MSILSRVIIQVIKEKDKSEYEDIHKKVDVFYAVGRITQEEYEYLISLLADNSDTSSDNDSSEGTIEDSGIGSVESEE